jgi:hypothetical protein
MNRKPLGQKSYGHIPHFPGSRMGPADHTCSPGQLTIATLKARDRHDVIIVQEKLDGSNVGVAKINGDIVPITRAGYLAITSPFEQHHYFAAWALFPAQKERFAALLEEGERVCGEWLMQAHGTRYNLLHEPFVPFDLMKGMVRLSWPDFKARVQSNGFTIANTIHEGSPFSIEEAMLRLKISGHGAIDSVEGAVWRVERYEQIRSCASSERRRKVDYLAKYVRPDKSDGIYLPEVSSKPPVYNWLPEDSAGQIAMEAHKTFVQQPQAKMAEVAKGK